MTEAEKAAYERGRRDEAAERDEFNRRRVEIWAPVVALMGEALDQVSNEPGLFPIRAAPDRP